MKANTTLVINSKGGSGKTTLATNLASCFAAHGIPTAIMDYDPQGSSLAWLRLRTNAGVRIHGANAAPAKAGRIRSIDMHVPEDTQQLLIDAPAGASGVLLQEMLFRADAILIPVPPSALDIHATANFVRDLLILGRVRTRSIRLAVVANRVRSAMPVYQPLERFLASLGLPLLARIRDSEVYLRAAETGIGIFEMDPAEAVAELGEFAPIVDWVDPRHEPAAARVIELPRVRRNERTGPLASSGSNSLGGGP
jgi:chromosome partitioning protein